MEKIINSVLRQLEERVENYLSYVRLGRLFDSDRDSALHDIKQMNEMLNDFYELNNKREF